MFKGVIQKGTKVEVDLSVDASASGPAILFIGYGSREGGQSDSTIVSPGTSAMLSLTPRAKGVFRVLVDMSSESNRGRLRASPVTPTENIQGDTTWGYAVI
jgi:hypothetical protein